VKPNGIQVCKSVARFASGPRTVDTAAHEGAPYSLYRVNERVRLRGLLCSRPTEGWYEGLMLSPDERPMFGSSKDLRGSAICSHPQSVDTAPTAWPPAGASRRNARSEGSVTNGDFK